MLFLQKGMSHGWAVAAGRDKKLTLRSQKHSCLARGVYKHQQNTVAATNFANDISWCGDLAGVRITTLLRPQQETWRLQQQKWILSQICGSEDMPIFCHTTFPLKTQRKIFPCLFLSTGGAQHPGAWSCPPPVTVHVFAWLSTLCLYQ